MTTAQITASVAAVAIVVVGAGAAIAAKNAEEGDFLYGLRASLYSDTSVDADLSNLQNVYSEAEDLESRDALTVSERARLTATYTMHVNALQRRIAELEADGDAEAATRLRADLRAALRDFDDIFRNVDTSMSSASSMNSSDQSMSAMSNSSMSTGTSSMNSAATSSAANSSIFSQPSSSTTSA